MTVAVRDRPAPLATGPKSEGGVPARRAMVRWAWRLFQREWRQQVLVLGLLVLSLIVWLGLELLFPVHIVIPIHFHFHRLHLLVLLTPSIFSVLLLALALHELDILTHGISLLKQRENSDMHIVVRTS